MIILIDGWREQHSGLLDQMHRLRARVFQGRLGWEVSVVDGRERDRFDDVSPLYVLSVTPEGQVIGCLRALQTTGPNMLSDVFSELLGSGTKIRSPLIWESTRFCVDMEFAMARSRNTLSTITAELLCGLVETGLAAGLSHIVSVYDIRMERVLMRAGCDPVRLAPPKVIGGVQTIAGLFEVNQAFVDRLHSAGNLAYPAVDKHTLRRIGLAA
jgi:acyl homoserine lactone synthase